MKPKRLLRLAPMLLVPLLYPTIAIQANALGMTGDIVEIQWNGHPTKARVDHCRTGGCDLYLWDAATGKWSDGTLWMATNEIRGRGQQRR